MVNSAGAIGELLAPVDTRMLFMACGIIDRRGRAPDQGDQAQIRQALDQFSGEGNSFADSDDYLGWVKAFDKLVRIAGGLAVTNHVMAGKQRKAGQLIDNVLIIVRNDYFHGGSGMDLFTSRR